MSTAPTMNIRGLTATPPASELARFTDQELIPRRAVKSMGMTVVFPAVLIGVLALMCSSMLGGGISLIYRLTRENQPVPLFPTVLPMVGLCIAAVLIAVLGYRRRNRQILDHYRLWMFASDNNLEYRPSIPSPPLPGMVFHLGSGRVALNVLRGTVPRFVEFGNHQYVTSNGKNSTTHIWGYLAVKLDTPLPHIVLDAKSNNVIGSNLPVHLNRHQRLSLEGNFDQHFTLFCPEGYEPDALYLFTPDIMQRFLGMASGLDVEIVDDWLFFYSNRPFSTTDPGMWAYLFGVVSAMLDKLAQWERWRDDRLAAAASVAAAPPVPAPTVPTPGTALPQAPAGLAVPQSLPPLPPKGVAPPGRRLKAGIPAWAWILVGVLLLGPVLAVAFAALVTFLR